MERSITGMVKQERDSKASSSEIRGRTRADNFPLVLDPAKGPISATCFNRNGTMQAYAVSYDWHKGHSGMTPGLTNKIMLHPCKDEEVKKKSK